MVAFDRATLSKLTADQLKTLIWRQKWLNTARPNQLPPPGDWTEWGLMAGRGFGKSLCGNQWLAIEAVTDPLHLPSAVIAPTLNDVRYTCFEGHTGILTLIPPELVAEYNKTNLIITLTNGSIIRGFSSEEPERLRGPQFCRCYCDEISSWSKDEETWDMMMFGLRLGPNPKVVWTTTPKPKDLIRKLVAPKAGRHITTGSTYDNKANLPDSFFDQLKQYEGTQLGRQELEGELIDAEEGGVIKRSWIRLWPHDQTLPKFEFLVMSLDTAFTEKTVQRKTLNADPTACGVWGVFWHEDRTNILLLDCWEDHLSLPDLTKRVKKEMEIAYGDDDDAPMLKPMFGPSRSTQGYGAGRKPDIILIEEKGSGISLRQNLSADGIDTYAYNPGRADKLTRLHLCSDVFARGQVWVPESDKKERRGKPRSWCDNLIVQICSYRGPGSVRHDDQLDQATQAIIFCKNKGLITAVKKDKAERTKDRDREENPPPKSRGNPYAQ